jgi:hypothetical protein
MWCVQRRTLTNRVKPSQVYPDDTDSDGEDAKKVRRQARRASLTPLSSSSRGVDEEKQQTGLRRATTFLLSATRSRYSASGQETEKKPQEKDIMIAEEADGRLDDCDADSDADALEGDEKREESKRDKVCARRDSEMAQKQAAGDEKCELKEEEKTKEIGEQKREATRE